MKNSFIIALLFPLMAFIQTPEVKKIKVKPKRVDKAVHFKSFDYIVSFRLQDIVSMSNELDFPFTYIENDTTDIHLFIHEVDSLGKGNRLNNFRLNNRFKQLLDKGHVKIYSLNGAKEVLRIVKEVREQTIFVTEYSYKEGDNTILRFYEPWHGCPDF